MLFQALCFITTPLELILTLLGLIWYWFPYSYDSKQSKLPFIYFTVFEVLLLVCAGLYSAFLIFQSTILSAAISVPHFLFSTLMIPILYDGTIFSSSQSIQVSRYILLSFEIIINFAYISIICTIPRWWIIAAAASWRLILLFEPFAFWCSLHSIISPYRAMYMAKSARSLIAVFLLHFEHFFILYCCFWFMKQSTINSIILYTTCVYYSMFFLYQFFGSGFSCVHKIKPISMAKHAHEEVDLLTI